MPTPVINLKSHRAKSVLQSDGRIVRTYTETYLYRLYGATSFPTDADIAADIGIAPGSPYSEDSNATAGDAEIEWLMSRPAFFKAEVTINWATNNPAVNEVDTDPATVHKLWAIKPTIQQRYIIKNRHDELILNTAGQPFDGGVPVDVRLGQASLKLKILDASFDYALVMSHSGKWNSATFLGGDPGTVQVDITATEAYEGAYHFWDVQYDFNYDPLGWQPKIANVGFYQLGTLDVPVPITYGDLATPPTADDTRVPEPESLDESGHVVPYANRPDDCILIEVDYFDSLDMATLPGVT